MRTHVLNTNPRFKYFVTRVVCGVCRGVCVPHVPRSSFLEVGRGKGYIHQHDEVRSRTARSTLALTTSKSAAGRPEPGERERSRRTCVRANRNIFLNTMKDVPALGEPFTVLWDARESWSATRQPLPCAMAAPPTPPSRNRPAARRARPRQETPPADRKMYRHPPHALGSGKPRRPHRTARTAAWTGRASFALYKNNYKNK